MLVRPSFLLFLNNDVVDKTSQAWSVPSRVFGNQEQNAITWDGDQFPFRQQFLHSRAFIAPVTNPETLVFLAIF